MQSLLLATPYGPAIENWMYRRSVHYAPRGPELDAFLAYMNSTYSTFKTLRYRIHDSEGAAINYIQDSGRQPLALIVLREISPEKVNYVIRQVYDTLPNTNQISNTPALGLDDGYLRYLFSGYMTFKKSIDEWAWQYTNATESDGNCRAPPQVVVTPFPTFAYNQNPFYMAVGFLLGLAMIMSTMYPMSKLAKSVVEEKELKMRELMKIMGLRDSAHQWSWFISSFVLFFWIALTCTLVTTASFLKASSSGLVFMFFFLFAMSEITLAFLVSVFFSNSKLAAIAAPVVIFATILPRYIFYTVASNEQVGNKILSCLLSPTAFAFAADFLSAYEYAGVGIHPYNMFEGQFSFGTCLIMMFVDFFIYAFLAWYLDQVLPQEHGTPKHWWFVFSLRYWFPCFYGKMSGEVDWEDMVEFRGDGPIAVPPDQDLELDALTAGTAPVNDKIEHLPRTMLDRATVRIKSLSKTYPDGKQAVRDVSLSMLEGQITCLLGHNGAGKSTTISALTGMTEATGGDVSIYGFLLSEQLPAIRQLTGLCPQTNVLFPNLSVREHLVFFGKLKGMYGAVLAQHVIELVQQVGLTEKLDIRSASLSGGMKRKLCLAMALVGDPKFVLLDEPTSGMDPYSRRATWELLQKAKVGRVILLTTHFMDEADTLADRIAILSEGMLLCSGSSLFLKNRFGAGYLLTVTKSSAEAQEEPIEMEVKQTIQEAKLISSIAAEMVFQLPLNSASGFSKLFNKLEGMKATDIVSSFGISITSLEQVFISLAHSNTQALEAPRRTAGTRMSMAARIFPCSKDDRSYERVSTMPSAVPIAPAAVIDEDCKDDLEEPVVTEKEMAMGGQVPIGTVSVFKQVSELYRKRLIIASRDLKGFFFQIIFPAIQILLIMLILNVNIQPAGHTIILNGNMFDRYGDGLDVSAFVANPTANSNAMAVGGGFERIDLPDRWNSSRLSNYLLDRVTFEDQRYGAMIFDDSIPFHITVDWDWVAVQLNNTGNIGNRTNNLLMSVFGEDYSYTVSNNSLLLFNFTQTVNITQGIVLLDNLFNLTTTNLYANVTSVLNRNNITWDQLSNVTNTALVALLAQTGSGDSTIEINRNGITLTLSTNLTGVPDVTQVVAWDDITFTTVAPFLPTSVQSYNFSLPAAYSVLHNSTSPHALAAWHGELTEAAFQTCQNNAEAEYYTKNHPLPLTVDQSLQIKIILSLLTSVFILVPLCYIPAAFVSFLVRERVSKSKHLQIACGVQPALYWTAAYLWDLSLFAILTGFILMAFYIVGQSAASVFVGSAISNLAVLCLVMVYGASAIPLNYLYSLAFTNHSTAQISITLINFMSGFVLVLAYYVMVSVPETAAAAELLVHIFRIFPAYNIGEGFINLSTSYYENTILGGNSGPFDWLVCGRCMVFMFAEAVGFAAMVLMTESRTIAGWFGRYSSMMAKRYGPPPPPKRQVDEDVLQEEALVKQYVSAMHTADTVRTGEVQLEEGGNKLALLIHGLIKTYLPLDFFSGKSQPKYALRGLSLACKEGERFGLLGINGAGKTTTLGILTGEIYMTAGEVYIDGQPLADGNLAQPSMLGYCPQVDPLLDLMTGLETLRFFGRIRGLDEVLLERRVQALVKQTGLLPHAHRMCGTYSGGNKRKLSLAVALIGDPKVLLLDEVISAPPLMPLPPFCRSCADRCVFQPSTGMDPEARRQMWNVIEQVSAQRTVVLVSHSMEEIEALCTRVAVMVSGRMQCLGSVQHLKTKFGGAYTVELRCATDSVTACLALLQTALPGAFVEEQHGGFLRMRVERDAINLASIFALLESKKDELQIYDYSVSQCSLEQVFIKFAKDQEEEPAADAAGAAVDAEGHIELQQVPPERTDVVRMMSQEVAVVGDQQQQV